MRWLQGNSVLRVFLLQCCWFWKCTSREADCQSFYKHPSPPQPPPPQSVPVSFIYGHHDWMNPAAAQALALELDRVRPRSVRIAAACCDAACCFAACDAACCVRCRLPLLWWRLLFYSLAFAPPASSTHLPTPLLFLIQIPHRPTGALRSRRRDHPGRRPLRLHRAAGGLQLHPAARAGAVAQEREGRLEGGG